MTEIIHNFEKVHKKDLETITQVLVKITHRSPEEIKPHLDIMVEHLITPKQETATRENCSEIFLRKKPIAPVQWQADMKALALDSKSGRDVVNLMQTLAKEQGCTILLVTHDNRILDIADRIVHMEDGKLVKT